MYFPSNKQAFSFSLNSNFPGQATHPTVTPSQQATYCRFSAGSAMFPVNFGPRWGHLSGQVKVVAGLKGRVVTHSSAEEYKHWLHRGLNSKLSGQQA